MLCNLIVYLFSSQTSIYIIKTEKERFSLHVNLFGQFYSSVLVPAIDICHGAARFSEIHTNIINV